MPSSASTVHVYQGVTLKASPSVNQSNNLWDAGAIAFSAGDQEVKARSEDVAGNFSGYVTKHCHFGSTTVPAIPDLLDDSGESSSDNITNDDTPRIKLTLTLPIPAGASAVAQSSVGKLVLTNEVEAEIGSEIPNYTAPNIFDYTFQLTQQTNGAHGFRAKWRDANDVESGASTVLEITVDTIAPNVPSFTGLTEGQVFVGTTVNVNGVAT